MAAAVDGSIIIDTKMLTNGFTAGVKRLTGSVKSLAAVVGVAFGVGALASLSKQAISLASDVEEVQNVVDVAFGGMKQKCEDFAETAIEQFGMSELAAKKTASTYMAMSKSMGLSMDAASDMAVEVAGLTGDVASFFNLSQDLAATKLKAIWTGETEGMKDLGVVMTQANLQQFAYQKGIRKNISAMTQAEQVTLRYQYVTEQLSLAHGDFARTSGSWANQTRILTERWKEFLSIMGNGLITALTPALQFLNNLMAKLIEFANGFVALVNKLFGKGGKEATTTISTVTKGMGELEDATAAVGAAADNALAGFDDLDVLSDPSALSGSGTGDGELSSTISVPELPGDADELPAWAQTVYNWISKIKEISDGKFGENIVAFLEGFWSAIKPIVTTVVDAVIGAVEWLIKTVAGADPNKMKDVGAGVGAIVAGLSIVGLVLVTGNTLTKIGNGLKAILLAVKGHPLLAVATGIAGIITAVKAYNDYKFNATETGKFVRHIKEVIDNSGKYTAAAEDYLNALALSRSEVENKYGGLSLLAERYYNLTEQATLTEAERGELVTLAGVLVEEIPALANMIDTETGAYKGTREELQRLINTTKEYYLLQGAQSSLTGLSEQIYGLMDEQSVRQGAVAEAQAKLNALYADLDALKAEMKNPNQGSAILDVGAREDLIQQISKKLEQIDAAKGVLEYAQSGLDLTNEKLEKLNAEFERTTDFIATYSNKQSIASMIGDIALSSRTAAEELDGLSTAGQAALGQMKGQLDADGPGIKTGIEGISSSAAQAGDSISNMPADMDAALGKLQELLDNKGSEVKNRLGDIKLSSRSAADEMETMPDDMDMALGKLQTLLDSKGKMVQGKIGELQLSSRSAADEMDTMPSDMDAALGKLQTLLDSKGGTVRSKIGDIELSSRNAAGEMESMPSDMDTALGEMQTLLDGKGIEVQDKIGDIGGAADGAGDSFGALVGAAQNAIDGVVAAFEGDNSATTAVRNWLGDMSNVIAGYKFPIISMPAALQSAGSPSLSDIAKTSIIQPPHYATGAVIPPNARHLAVVGDNTRENEIIAPESTFRRIVQEELASMGSPTVNITATGDTAALVRFFKFRIDKETRRQGKSLIEGGAR